MPLLDRVDASFFERAPQVVQHRAHVAAPRERVFAAVADDPAGWGRWFPGFSDDGQWETPPPHGVGSIRTVHAWHVRYRETIVAWEQDQRWAFRVDETRAPMFDAFAEDYRFSDAGSGTLWTWTVAMRLRPAFRPGLPLVRAGLGLVLRRAAAQLAKVA